MHKFDYFVISSSVKFLLPTILTREVGAVVDCYADSDPCLHGGKCAKGANKCLCNNGFSGETCQYIEPEVKCLGDRIEVHIQKIWAEHYAKITSHKQLYLGKSNADNEQCQASPHPYDTGQYLLTVSGLSSCGTNVTRDATTQDFVYRNAVYSNRFSETVNDELKALSLMSHSGIPAGDGTDPGGGSDALISRLPQHLRLLSLVEWTCYYQHKYRLTAGDGMQKAMEHDGLVPSAVLLKSGAQITIETYGKPLWTAENRMHQRSYKKIANGDSLYFEISTATPRANFLIQECAMVNRPGLKTKNLQQSNYHQQILLHTNGCPAHLAAQTDSTKPLPSVTVIESAQLGIFRFAVMMIRDDWTEPGYDGLDPTVYIHCILQESGATSPGLNSCPSKNDQNASKIAGITAENHDYRDLGVVEIEAGPFQLKIDDTIEYSADDTISFELEGGDEEHSLRASEGLTEPGPFPENGESENQPPSQGQAKAPPLREIFKILNSLENDAGETREGAWEKMMEIIDLYENAEARAAPMVHLKSSFDLSRDEIYLAEHDLPIFRITPDIKIKKDINSGVKKVHTMILLAIVIGAIFCGLIVTPVVIACYKNYTKGSPGRGKAQGKKTKEYPRTPVQAAKVVEKDNGLGAVDHELYFVEYADNVHDLVWDQNQQEQAGWIKQQSIDAQSIDISMHGSSSSEKSERARLENMLMLRSQMPSYVVFGNGRGRRGRESSRGEDEALSPVGVASKPSPRRGSIKLAGYSLFGTCTGGKITNVPYKNKSRKGRRSHV